MKKLIAMTAIVLLSSAITSHGDTVVKKLPDTKPGQLLGGVLGLMVGSIGGPLGALAGGSLSWFAGGKIQQASGVHGKAYEVKKEDGSLVVIRSPNKQWQPGDKVRIENARLVAMVP